MTDLQECACTHPRWRHHADTGWCIGDGQVCDCHRFTAVYCLRCGAPHNGGKCGRGDV